ncbi:MAG: rhomboid family intramembrane serine protease [Micrococcales bacterium]|nr:rhomboid family intramembrane serine protease [Micrococcales bacterium]
MSSTNETEIDPSVCYRHPGRQSWVLCQRCGRTICPECQILAPVGVQCPECVREAGGSVTWAPRGGPRPSARGRGRSASRTTGNLRGYLAAETGPHLSWIIVGASLLLWVVGFLSQNAPFSYLAAGFGEPWQLWRYATSWLVQPSIPGGTSILATLLNLALFAYFGPFIERMMGRSRFAVIFFAGAVFGGAIGVLAGGVSWGLTPGLYAVFVAYGVAAMRSGANVTLLWAFMAFNVIFTAVAAISALPQLIAGGLAGLGLLWLLDIADRPSRRSRTLIIWGVVGAAVALATLKTVALSAGG